MFKCSTCLNYRNIIHLNLKCKSCYNHYCTNCNNKIYICAICKSELYCYDCNDKRDKKCHRCFNWICDHCYNCKKYKCEFCNNIICDRCINISLSCNICKSKIKCFKNIKVLNKKIYCSSLCRSNNIKLKINTYKSKHTRSISSPN